MSDIWSILILITALVIIPVTLGIICDNIMKKKGRSAVGGFLLGFFLRFIGLIIALCLSTDNYKLSQQQQVDNKSRWICKKCGEKNDSSFCSNCGERKPN